MEATPDNKSLMQNEIGPCIAPAGGKKGEVEIVIKLRSWIHDCVLSRINRERIGCERKGSNRFLGAVTEARANKVPGRNDDLAS
jgi:hypothetical protein